uniref:serine--tRNA ligase n=1 Tax=Pristionchus pacificus TaxID=54126 RepID=A0A8R1UXF6_PRIPA
MKSKLLTEVPFEQLEMSGSNLTDGVFALLVKAIEAHGVNRLSLNVGNVKNRDPITALFRLSTLVRSLHITQHHYNTYGAHEFFGRYSLDWALVFLKMFSNKLDKLRVENRSFKDYLSIEQANVLVERLPLLEKHVWFEATCNKYDNGLSVERDGYWIEDIFWQLKFNNDLRRPITDRNPSIHLTESSTADQAHTPKGSGRSGEMAGAGGELLIVDHVKYRTSDAGKSPIGSLHLFTEYVEWRDSSSPVRHKIAFGDIKGQKVSPPHKPKVQLQIVMQDEGQSTFVFLRPNTTREQLVAERDTFKETLQQALVAHRQRVQQMTKSAESGSRDAEIVEKRRILQQSKQLEELYKHLVTSKLLTPQDFWTDYYKTTGKSEERTGMTGAFLANIAQSDTNGLKLNLNTNIIQNIFATYPMVERKHLELVPHEMSEEEFWVKFATSHYFHREREVLPNPDDPFADCVKADEEEISKLVSAGAKRKRLNFDYLSDNVVSEINGAQRSESSTTLSGKDKQRTTLIRRCNYLSERILQTQQVASANAAAAASSSSTTSAPGAANGTTNGVNGEGKSNGSGYAVLHRWMGDSAEDAMESAELAEEEQEMQLQPIKVADGTSLVVPEFTADEVARFRTIIHDFIDDVTQENIINTHDDWLLAPSTSNVIGRVNELVKHFWTCFPPVTPELEAKIERMEQTLRRYEQTALAEAEQRFGPEAFVHTRDMIVRAHEKYTAFQSRKKNKPALPTCVMLSRRLSHNLLKFWSRSVASTAEGPPQRIRGAAVKRPEFDFDYLLEPENLEKIRDEIKARKGVGDIDALHATWSEIQSIMGGERRVEEREYERLWDALYSEAARIPNRTYEGAVVVDVLNPDAKRVDPSLKTAEQIVHTWRSLLHPTEASGQRSYTFIGPLARLERAVLEYAWARVQALGFKPVLVSDLVPRDIGEACGMMHEGMQYTLDRDPSTVLSGTAEMGIAAMLRGTTFPAEELPLRFVALSRYTVEMFTVCAPSQSAAELSFLVDVQKDTLRNLGLHARVLEMPSEELGASAHRKYDIEAWMPGRKLFGEVSSASNCTDFQSRRLGIRYTDSSGARHFAHTCNGTAIAVPRALIAILETFQDEKRKGSMREFPESIRHRIERSDASGKPIRDEKIKFQTGPSFF